jgi:hypothetical protein
MFIARVIFNARKMTNHHRIDTRCIRTKTLKDQFRSIELKQTQIRENASSNRQHKFPADIQGPPVRT